MAHSFRKTFLLMLAGAALSLALACGGGGGGSSAPPASQGSWGSAKVLETNLLSDSYYPLSAIDATGRTLVVWQRLSGPGGPSDIWGKVFEPGSGWQPEGTLESMDGDGQRPVVAVGGNGVFLVAWQHTPVGGTTGIWANRYTPGVGWSGPLQISGGSTAAAHPSIAADGSGNAVVVWEQANALAYLEVRASRYSVLAGWSAPVLLGSSATLHNFAASVAMDPAGNAMAMWNRAASTTTGVWTICAVPYRVGSGWQVPATVPSLQAGVEGVDDAYGYSVSMSPAGAVVGWAESLGGGAYRPLARIWNPSTGAWSAAAMVAGTQVATYPVVGIDASGKVHAAWAQSDGTDWTDLFVASYNPDGTFSVSPKAVDGLSGGIGSFALDVNTAGSAALVWTQMGTTVTSVYGMHYSAATGWAGPKLLENDDAGSAYAADVKLSAGGSAIATWYQKDAAGIRHVCANRWN